MRVDKIVTGWEWHECDRSGSVAVPASSFHYGNPGHPQHRSVFQHQIGPWIIRSISWGQEAEEHHSSCGDLQEHCRIQRLELPGKDVRSCERSRGFNYCFMSALPLN